jgi:hypothetical protein
VKAVKTPFRYLLIVLCMLAATAGRAQSPQVETRYQAWAGLLEQITFSEKWNVTLDVQGRYEYTDGDWYVFLARPGVTYSPSGKFMFTAGAAYFLLFPNPNGRPARPEWRPWQEVSRKYKTGAGTFWPRIRTEQRFIREYDGEALQESFTYNAFRVRLRCDWTLPLGETADKGFYLAAGNEIFFGVKPGGFSAFDQNRASAGAGYRFSPTFAVQLQYLNFFQQFTSSRFELHHTARVTILHELRPAQK